MFLVKKGFTLIELLVVISIIAILVAFGAVAYSNAQKKARDARRINDMKDMQKAMEQSYGVAGTYDALESGSSAGVCVAVSSLSPIPTDPRASVWTPYSCVQNASLTDFCACARLEGGTGGNSSGGADGSCSGLNNGTSYFCVKNKQ